MKKSTAVSFIALFIILMHFTGTGCSEEQDNSPKLPSIIYEQALDSAVAFIMEGNIITQEKFDVLRNKAARILIDSVQTEGLNREESVKYGDLLSWAGRTEKATSVLQELEKGDDVPARRASISLMSMEMENKRYGAVEELISRYRKHFSPTPDYLANLYGICRSLSNKYNDINQPENAIHIIMDELNSLPFDVPYMSFYLFEELTPLMMEKGLVSRCKSLLAGFKTKLEIALKERKEAIAVSDTTSEKDDPFIKKYNKHIKYLGTLMSHCDMIGKKAPELKFIHVYNADTTFEFKDLEGKVTLIDFWATWCYPCMESFKNLGRIYSDYRNREFEILGITSFQGVYEDMATGTTEGSPENPLDKEKEIEITGSFLEKHNIVWPCAFTVSSVFNEEYAVQGIPTFAILDKKGNIRFVQIGAGSEAQKRRIIDSCLNQPWKSKQGKSIL